MASSFPERRSPSRRFLPPDPRTSEPYRFTPQLALRLGVLAAIALAVFAVLFLRLWALQVLSGDRYLNAAQSNQLRTVPVEAPRGSIVDRAGRTIVSNVPGTAVQIWAADLPEEGRYAMFKKLSKILRVPLPRLTKALEKSRNDPLTPILVKTAVHEDQVMYLKEHRDEFPGVEIVGTYLRDYRVPRACRPGARIRRRDLAGRAEAPGEGRLPRRREDRQDWCRSLVRHLPARHRGRRAAAGQLARSPAGGVRAPPARDAGKDRPPDDRRRPPARRRACDPRGDRARAGAGGVQRQRRRDRRARPARRRRARDGLEPHLQALRLRRPGRPEEARAAHGREGGKAAQLSGHQPRDRRRLPARLDVQAADGARGDLGRAALAVRVHPVHAVRRVRPRRASASTTGTRS